MQNEEFKILSFDIESCTGSQKDGSLCSFGYYLADSKFQVIEHDDILVNPMPKVFNINQNTYFTDVKLSYPEEVFRASPTFEKHYDRIKNLFQKSTYAIGFAVINDVKYVNDACAKYNLEKIEYKFIDVQHLVKCHLKQKTPMGLKKICEHLEIEYVAHRSDEDARVTLIILEKLCAYYQKSIPELLLHFNLRCDRVSR